VPSAPQKRIVYIRSHPRDGLEQKYCYHWIQACAGS
jgi:hypothetical protein